MTTYNPFGGEFYRMADDLSAAVAQLEADYGPELFIQSPSLLFMEIGRLFIKGMVDGLTTPPRPRSGLRWLWWVKVERPWRRLKWRMENRAEYRKYRDSDDENGDGDDDDD
jgi:hypothetical protein